MTSKFFLLNSSSSSPPPLLSSPPLTSRSGSPFSSTSSARHRYRILHDIFNLNLFIFIFSSSLTSTTRLVLHKHVRASPHPIPRVIAQQAVLLPDLPANKFCPRMEATRRRMETRSMEMEIGA
eukprot:764797-Hanusia_phi.AAC.2